MFPFFLVVGLNVHKEQKSSTDFDYLEEIVGKMSTQHQEYVGFFKERWVKHRENHCLPLPLLPKEELTVMIISQEHPSLHAELKLFCQWTRMYTHSISNQHILHQWKHSGGWLGNLVHHTQQLSTLWCLQLLSRGQVWQWQRSEL